MVFIIVLSEKEFILLQQRDKGVLTKVYENFSGNIMTYLLIKTFGNRDVAEDLVQETFCAIIDTAPRFKSPKYLTFTIFRIAKNKLVDYQRELFRQKKHTIPFVKSNPDFSDKNQDIIEAIDHKQKVLLLKLAYESLNPFYREVYEMRYIKDMKIKEIAAHYKKTYKAIDNVLVRIRSTLKKEMKNLTNNFF